MADQLKRNLYTCWCGKPRSLELHYCKEHTFLEDNLKQAQAEVLAALLRLLSLGVGKECLWSIGIPWPPTRRQSPGRVATKGAGEWMERWD